MVTSRKSLVLSVLAGLCLPILIPTGHMLIFTAIWGASGVDRDGCRCSCWDNVFKGPYEDGVANYKHVYFNSTFNTFYMWVITVILIIAFYETVKHLALLKLKGRLRWSMALLLVFSIHSHYYAWWNHWNHWNDDYYTQSARQLFFTCTELVSSILVISQADKRRAAEPLPLILIGTISAFHILSATWDQFYGNVILGEGEVGQVLRDLFLMATDVIQVLVVYRELRGIADRMAISLCQLIGQNFAIVAQTTIVMFVYLLFCPPST